MAEEVIIRSKEKNYRGISLDDLKSMTLKEVAEHFPARSRRSILRHPEFIEKFIKNCEEKLSKNKRIRTHLRDIIIVPRMVGWRVGVHNGRAFEDFEITAEMLGHRLGEFSMTRKRVAHSGAGVGATRGSKAAKK